MVAEPTGLVAGARAIAASSTSPPRRTGVQAHSSTGKGRNANWALIPFLAEMKAIHERLRDRPGAAGRRLRPALLRLQPDRRQPRHGGERDRRAGHRAHQVPLQREAWTRRPILAEVRAAAGRAGLELTDAARGPAARAAGGPPADRARRRADRPGGAHRALRHRCERAAGDRPLRRARARAMLETAHTPRECVRARTSPPRCRCSGACWRRRDPTLQRNGRNWNQRVACSMRGAWVGSLTSWREQSKLLGAYAHCSSNKYSVVNQELFSFRVD